jgi:ribosomal protein S18 acetylase RimI-like enzyme
VPKRDQDLRLIERLSAYIEATAEQRAPDVAVVAESQATRVKSLSEIGYGETSRVELLTCTAGELATPPAVPGLAIVTIDASSALEDVRDGLDANERGFNPAAPATTDPAAEEFRRGLVRNRAFVAYIDGALAAGAMFNPPVDGVAEIVGVATIKEFRNRGIGAYLTAYAARTAFELDVDVVFLSTLDPVARRIYDRLGFKPRATLVSLRPPSAS